MSEWVSVDQATFFGAMGPLDVTPRPRGPWPYTTLWQTPRGETLGKVVEQMPEGAGQPLVTYWLPPNVFWTPSPENMPDI